MKILRIFVDFDLNVPINWQLVEQNYIENNQKNTTSLHSQKNNLGDDGYVIQSGSSLFENFFSIKNLYDTVECYFNTNLSNIFKLDIEKSNTNNDINDTNKNNNVDNNQPTLDDVVNLNQTNINNSAYNKNTQANSNLTNLANAFGNNLSNNKILLNTIRCPNIDLKKMSKEFLLNLIEDYLIDGVDDSEAFLIESEDNDYYIMTINKTWYNNLTTKLFSLNKKITALCPFVMATDYTTDVLTIYYTQKQKFIRTSCVEYIILDDTHPCSKVLDEIISHNLYANIKNVILYTSNDQELSLQDKFNNSNHETENSNNSTNSNSPNNAIDEKMLIEHIERGGKKVAKHYKQHHLNHLSYQSAINNRCNLIRYDNKVSKILRELSRYKMPYWARYIIFFYIIANLLIICSILALHFEKNRLDKLVETKINSSIDQSTIEDLKLDNIIDTKAKISTIKNNIEQMRHDKAQYVNNKDFIPLMYFALRLIPQFGADSIVGINYQDNKLEIFVNNTFVMSNISGYIASFSYNSLNLQILDASLYKIHKSNKKNKNKSSGGLVAQMENQNEQDRFIEQFNSNIKNSKYVLSISAK